MSGMHKFKSILILILYSITVKTAFAQLPVAAENKNLAAVEQTVDGLFEAMYQNDSSALLALFAENAQLLTITVQGDKKNLVTESLADFATAVATPKTERWKEVPDYYKIEANNELASVWCPYHFYIEENGVQQLIHCGVNSIELYYNGSKWLITQITDTRSVAACKE